MTAFSQTGVGPIEGRPRAWYRGYSDDEEDNDDEDEISSWMSGANTLYAPHDNGSIGAAFWPNWVHNTAAPPREFARHRKRN